MSLQSINRIHVEATPSVFTIPQPTQREIDSLVSWVRSEGQIDYYTVSMVLESAVIRSAIRAGKIVCVENVLMLPGTSGESKLEQVEQLENVPASAAAPANDELDRQIAAGKESQDPAYRVNSLMLEQCLTGTDWLDEVVAEIESEEKLMTPELPELPRMKLKNADRNDDYWFFVGDKDSAFFCLSLLAKEGTYTSAKPNGSTGCYSLKVPRWFQGKLENTDKLAA